MLPLLTVTVLSTPASPAEAASCGNWAGQPVAAKRVTAPQWSQRWLDPGRLHQLGTGAGVRVAVLDTGVDLSHPQLAKATEEGWDVVTGKAGNTVDCVGHGTAVASLLAARPDGDASLIGVAPGARIVPIRVSEDGTGASSYRDVTPARLAEGIHRALTLRAGVIQVSFAVSTDAPALRNAVAEAVRRGVVVVAAVGDETTAPTYPASYTGVIGVGAVDPSGQRWADSGLGRQVDLMAPGVGVVAAARVGGHIGITGTAAAAALVSGAAALVRAGEPKWTGAQVTQRLLATADGTPGGSHSETYGYGCVNPYRAMAELIGTPEPSPERIAVPAPARDMPARPGMPSTTLRALLWASGIGVVTAVLAIGYAAVAMRHRRRGKP